MVLTIAVWVGERSSFQAKTGNYKTYRIDGFPMDVL